MIHRPKPKSSFLKDFDVPFALFWLIYCVLLVALARYALSPN